MITPLRRRESESRASADSEPDRAVSEVLIPEGGVVIGVQLFDGRSFSYRPKEFTIITQTPPMGRAERLLEPNDEVSLYVKRGDAYEVVRVRYVGVARTADGAEVPIVKFNDKYYPLKKVVDGPDIFDQGLALLNR